MRLVKHNSYDAITPTREERKAEGPNGYTPSTVVMEGILEHDAMIQEVEKFMFGNYIETEVQIGWSRTHPNDDFCRKTGLALAQSRLAPVTANLTWATIGKDALHVIYECRLGKFTIKYQRNKRPVLAHESITGHIYY